MYISKMIKNHLFMQGSIQVLHHQVRGMMGISQNDDIDDAFYDISDKSNIVQQYTLKLIEPVIAEPRPSPEWTVDGSILS